MADQQVIIYGWTPMIRMSDMRYPVYLTDFKNDHKNVSIGSWVFEESMYDFEYYMVRDVEIPTGDVVEEGQPVKSDEDGKWYKTWTSRDFTAEEIAENLRQAKENAKNQALNVYSNDLMQGVTVEGSVFAVEPRELNNLETTRAFSVAFPDKTVMIRTATSEVLSMTSVEAQVKIEDILVAAGQVQQSLLAYIKSVNETTLITDVPEVPVTFLGE